ncbi:MAG: hypothetical protein FRX49_05100 [Trebouxia sp. A1-2]|nr:MAG: hypothetical protein FRX49_05100 [Trebouxia sp. A1-2]
MDCQYFLPVDGLTGRPHRQAADSASHRHAIHDGPGGKSSDMQHRRQQQPAIAQSVQYSQQLGGKNLLNRMVVAPEVHIWMEAGMRYIREPAPGLNT